MVEHGLDRYCESNYRCSHLIWVGTADQQLMALSREFPGFYRYAILMEAASEAERKKVSRPYDGMAEFSEQYKQRGAQRLTTGRLTKGKLKYYKGFPASQAISDRGGLRSKLPRNVFVNCVLNCIQRG